MRPAQSTAGTKPKRRGIASRSPPIRRRRRTGAGSSGPGSAMLADGAEDEPAPVPALRDGQALEHAREEEEPAPALVLEVRRLRAREQALDVARIAAALVAHLERPAASGDLEEEAHPDVAGAVGLLHRALAAAVVDRVREQLAGDELERLDLLRCDALALREVAEHGPRHALGAVRRRQVEPQL